MKYEKDFREVLELITASDITDILFKNLDKIVELAEDRFMEGYKTYGTSSFKKSEKTLRKEIMEEFADIFAWLAIYYIKIGKLPLKLK